MEVTISLLSVGDHLSLEFDSHEFEAVFDFIKSRFRDLETQFAGLATIVRFGGEEFTFQDFWDDPCLISGTEVGDEMLRSVHKHFASQPRPS